MIDILLHKIAQLNSREEKFNVTREFLQILVLKILSDAQAFRGIAFIGGTALRILFQVRRYSEDLDFSVTSKSPYDFVSIINSIDQTFRLQNIPVEIKSKRGVVDSCMIHFTSVLQLAGISVARDQKLSVKLEIDTNPPHGAELEDTVINSEFIFPVRHFDIASLMAGKLHAVMFRKFSKGRDYYDLLWYLSRKIEPNIKLLENAILQTEGERVALSERVWVALLKEKLVTSDYKKIRRDVQPFVIDANEVELITKESFLSLLASY